MTSLVLRVHQTMCGQSSTHFTVSYAPIGRLRMLINDSTTMKALENKYATETAANRTAPDTKRRLKRNTESDTASRKKGKNMPQVSSPQQAQNPC